MVFIADEGLDRPIVEALRGAGFEVDYVAEFAAGTADVAILDHASSRGAILLTADKDFGELVFRRQLLSTGVVLVRLSGLKPAVKAEIVLQAVRDLENKMAGAFTVIRPGTIRIRHR